MRTVWAVILLSMVWGLGIASPITQDIAREKCIQFMAARDRAMLRVTDEIVITGENENLGYVYQLSPSGYVAISGDTDIFPIIAYSFENDFPISPMNPLIDMLRADLRSRIQNKAVMPRTALRYAIEKMPAELKAEAMKIR